MMLRHGMQHNIAKQGTYKAWSSKEAVSAANNWEIGNYCQKMASIEICKNKNHVEPFEHFFDDAMFT